MGHVGLFLFVLMLGVNFCGLVWLLPRTPSAATFPPQCILFLCLWCWLPAPVLLPPFFSWSSLSFRSLSLRERRLAVFFFLVASLLGQRPLFHRFFLASACGMRVLYSNRSRSWRLFVTQTLSFVRDEFRAFQSESGDLLGEYETACFVSLSLITKSSHIQKHGLKSGFGLTLDYTAVMSFCLNTIQFFGYVGGCHWI